MKRSEINQRILEAITFFNTMNFKLPPWANWHPKDWEGKKNEVNEIIENMLGWDLTDFGGGRFDQRGLLLFTIRNGNPHRDRKPYAEKIMIVEEDQETPMHFHWNKMEDIINRGGGNLVMVLFNCDEDENLNDNDIIVSVDGIKKRLPVGSQLVLTPGESICLHQGLYHRFYGEKGKGKVLVDEVSAVNNDNNDNRFLEDIGRFPEIEEDEPPLHFLVSDYKNFLL
ncbi:MAG: D-lyxose/D-mannose family sugar isomerase [Bacteroidales bacterium]|nr:D-lyxose/D-mannose family sugar isomerase [Bacteroidales bacterium]